MQNFAKQALSLITSPSDHLTQYLEELFDTFNEAFITSIEPLLETNDEIDEYPTMTFAPPPPGYVGEKLKLQNRGLQNVLSIIKPEASTNNFYRSQRVMKAKYIEPVRETGQLSSIQPVYAQFTSNRRPLKNTNLNSSYIQVPQQVPEPTIDDTDYTQQAILIQSFCRRRLAQQVVQDLYANISKIQQTFRVLKMRHVFNLRMRSLHSKTQLPPVHSTLYKTFKNLLKNQNDFKNFSKEFLNKNELVLPVFPLQMNKSAFFDSEKAEKELQVHLQENKGTAQQYIDQNKNNINLNINVVIISTSIGIGEIAVCQNEYVQALTIITIGNQKPTYYQKILNLTEKECSKLKLINVKSTNGNVFQSFEMDNNAKLQLEQNLKLNPKLQTFLLVSSSNTVSDIVYDKSLQHFCKTYKLLNLNNFKQQQNKFNAGIKQNSFVQIVPFNSFSNYIPENVTATLQLNNFIDYDFMQQAARNTFIIKQVEVVKPRSPNSQQRKIQWSGISNTKKQDASEHEISEIPVREVSGGGIYQDMTYEPLVPIKECDMHSDFRSQHILEYINKKPYEVWLFNRLAFQFEVQTVIQKQKIHTEKQKRTVTPKGIMVQEFQIPSDVSSVAPATNNQMHGFVTQKVISKIIPIRFCSTWFTLFDNVFTPLCSFEDLVEFIEDVPARCHGHITASQEDEKDMKENLVEIVNELMAQNYNGVFGVHFAISETVEPFRVTFGVTRQVLNIMASRLIREQGRQLYVQFSHSSIWKAKKELTQVIAQMCSFDSKDKDGWIVELNDSLVCMYYCGNKEIEQQKYQVKQVVKKMIAVIHQNDPQCATSILNAEANDRDVETTSQIAGLFRVLE
ncbi:Conserved_hypothetical protein [Hexamita inflata]|uniref:Uncharacterized protein n=1 Tax=Hexamita inflata TaxID=28002 RepID=A0AA86UDM6_9EUKA|nr:Conserved hypothetical protein [Hexamita inflata]